MGWYSFWYPLLVDGSNTHNRDGLSWSAPGFHQTPGEEPAGAG
jgi:hypothetical protein